MKLRAGSPRTLSAPAGDSLSLALSSTDSAWTFDVYARIGSLDAYLGRASATHPGQLTRPGRVVFVATCPGAQGWRIECAGGTANAIAEVDAAVSPHPLAAPGITYPKEP